MSPRFSVGASVRPTTNQAPAMTASQPPNIAVARFPEISSKKPPAAVTAPGKTSSQARAVLAQTRRSMYRILAEDEAADVAGMVPAVTPGLRGRFGVLVIAHHHQRAAHDDLAGRAGLQQVAVAIHQRDLDQRARPPGSTVWSVVPFVFGPVVAIPRP